jgi:hypothetical protein
MTFHVILLLFLENSFPGNREGQSPRNSSHFVRTTRHPDILREYYRLTRNSTALGFFAAIAVEAIGRRAPVQASGA